MSQETVEDAQPTAVVDEDQEGDQEEELEEINLESLLRDYEEWLSGQDEPPGLTLEYDADEDLWEVKLANQGSLVAYLSDIDADFYGEATALFLECELGEPDPQTDLSKLLRFSGQELVLSRISLSEREAGQHVLVVESACPFSQIDFEMLDLMIREVLAIATDVKGLL